METQKLQIGYTYLTEEEYNKIRSTIAKETLRIKNETVSNWLNRINKKINSELKELEEQRDAEAYKKFIGAN